MTDETRADQAASKPKVPRPCPICGKPSVPEARPFCSKRCADIDLHRWLGGVYAVAGDETTTEDPSDRESDDA